MAIFSRYRWLKASELMLFFFYFKAGLYERFYIYFNTQTIIRSIKTFLFIIVSVKSTRQRNIQTSN